MKKYQRSKDKLVSLIQESVRSAPEIKRDYRGTPLIVKSIIQGTIKTYRHGM